MHVQMLGMHGTVVANYAVDQADLLLAFGVRFDDRVTGKLETFAANAQIVHIDIDPAEINKNKEALLSVTGAPPSHQLCQPFLLKFYPTLRLTVHGFPSRVDRSSQHSRRLPPEVRSVDSA